MYRSILIDKIIWLLIYNLYECTQKHTQMKVKIESPYLTTAETLDYLRICRKTLYNWIEKGIITVYKIGNTNRFKRSELDAALRPVKPIV